ncbi:alpha/beta fold hydrolase [Burkholderia orbicola]|uniref:alpha/beta fold hydrolase n=1 Tax=Burkholderia orbicola TaxID=2978683 RepID=UPI003AF95007
MTTPSSIAAQQFSFVSGEDSSNVFVRKWMPSMGTRIRAMVQITHGIAEHGGRYEGLATFLAERGYIVYALDLCAHGETAGPDKLGQAGLNAWAIMTSDIRQLAEIARTEHPDLRLIAFGHSMGSALTQYHIQHNGDLLAGAILCGTMGAVPGIAEAEVASTLQRLHGLATGPDAQAPSPVFGELIAHLNAPFAQGIQAPTGCEWQTGDPDEIRRFLSDPLCAKPFSNSLTYAVLTGFRNLWIHEHESAIPNALPILIIAGTEDPVGDRTRSIRELIVRYVRQGHLALSYRFYEGGRHEILNDTGKERVLHDIEHWLSVTLDFQ